MTLWIASSKKGPGLRNGTITEVVRRDGLFWIVVPGLVIEVDRKLIEACARSDKKGPSQGGNADKNQKSLNPVAGGRSVSLMATARTIPRNFAETA